MALGLTLGLVLVLLALLSLLFFVIAPPPKRVSRERRLAPGEEYQSALTRVTDKTVNAIDTVVARRRRTLFNENRLELAGIHQTPAAFTLVVFALACVLALIGVAIGFGSLLSLVLGLIFAACAPLLALLLLDVRTSSRRGKFADQLDDTLQLVAGNLRAGHGLSQAIDSVAQFADPPTSEEFSRVVNESRIGRDLGEALNDTATRMKSDDFIWATQAIQINRETGGNLAETLSRTAATIRERNQIRRQVKALSAEGRMSAIILICLPFVVFAAVLLINPHYLEPFFASVIGWLALGFAAVLMIVGIVWMMAAVRVKF